MNRFLLIVICFLVVMSLQAKDKKRRKYDLGAMKVDGQAVAPGDLTVVDNIDLVEMNIYERKSFRADILKKFKTNTIKIGGQK